MAPGRKLCQDDVAAHTDAFTEVQRRRGLDRVVDSTRSGGELPADTAMRLDAILPELADKGDRVERLKLVLEAVGWNPMLELVRLSSINNTAAMFADELRKIVRHGINTEDECRMMESIAEYLLKHGQPKIALDAAKALAEYFYPKLRSSEIKQHVDGGLTVTVQKFGG
jgi:hypothetical protein